MSGQTGEEGSQGEAGVESPPTLQGSHTPAGDLGLAPGTNTSPHLTIYLMILLCNWLVLLLDYVCSSMTVINLFNKFYNVQAIISDLEENQGEERQKQDVVIRKLMRRKSKRETAAIWSEIRNGVLRRTNSVEDLSQGGEKRKTEVAPVERRPRTRVRHLSDGNYDDVSLVKTDAQDNVRVLRTTTSVEDNVRAVKTTTGVEDNVYENISFFQGSAQFSQTGQSGVATGDNPGVESR